MRSSLILQWVSGDPSKKTVTRSTAAIFAARLIRSTRTELLMSLGKVGDCLDVEPVVPGGDIDFQGNLQIEARMSSRRLTSSASRGISAAGASKTSSSWIWSSMRAAKPLLAQALVEQDHGPLDQVGGRALDDGVDRRALGKVARCGPSST